MESGVTLDTLFKLVPDLVFSAVLLYLYLRKLKVYETMADKLLVAYKDATVAQSKTANAIDNNTRAVEQLTRKVEQVDETTKAFTAVTEKINDVWRNTSGNTKS